MSGALIAPILAQRLGKTLILVRKKGESCHSGKMVEGDSAARRYIIVDDFVGYGDTVRAIFTAVGEFAPQAVCLGTYEFSRCLPTDCDEKCSIYGPHLTMQGLERYMLWYRNEKLMKELIDVAVNDDAWRNSQLAQLEAQRANAQGYQEQLDVGDTYMCLSRSFLPTWYSSNITENMTTGFVTSCSST